ncbi:MAG: response regulator transcription factor, partial [Atopobiaceae bacterium]|nr:response regulator transcription factor [Atopobiaceae bacterium]
ELLARIRVALKRHAAPAASAAIATNALTAHDVTLDVDRHEVTVEGTPVELTNREFEILHALMANPNIVQTREALASAALGYDYIGESNVIDVYIRQLRSKIDDRFGIKLITTVRGVGYVIRD